MAKAFNVLSGIFLKSELLRSSALLISGTVAAQMISIFLQPVIRRLYTPEDFGVFTVYMSLVAIIIIISSLKYDDAIVIPKSDRESLNILGLSLFLNFFVNLLIFLAIISFRDRIVYFLNLPSGFPVSLLWIIPAGAFLSSSFSSLNSWLIRSKKYLAVSLNKLTRRSTEAASQLIFAALKRSNGLMYSDLAGQSANVAVVLVQTKRNGLDFRLLSFSKFRHVLRKYSDFPKYSLLPALMSTCSFMLPPLFINKYYSAEFAGLFDLSKLVLSIPLALMSSSFSNVLLQKIAERYNKRESFIADLKPVLFVVLAVSVIELSSILIWGEAIFRIVFGQQWDYSGSISKIMVWSFVINFTVSSFTSIYIAMRRIKTYSVWQLFYFISIISLLFFRQLPFINFLRIYVLIEVFCYLIAGYTLYMIIRNYERSIKTDQ